MYFHSTNCHLPQGNKTKVDFKTALLKGQALDEGLFMPDFIPQLSKDQLLQLKNKPYWEIALEVLLPFLEENINQDDLKNILQEAYTFDIPIELTNDNLIIARMDAGPTASFKDFAAQLMARLMQKLKTKEQRLTILVATSGDTGSAIGEAFKDLEGIRVVILYPKDEVSTIQRKQLTTLGENITAIEILGKFDDCQAFVKKAFTDESLKNLNLTSANSINIGRLLPQMVYYFYIYSRVTQDFETINFCIPTGNLGNAMGCILAKKMGLPIDKILIATNANDAIPKWLESGTYEKISPSRNAISNAMNVGNPSNLARLFDLYGGTVDKDGVIHKKPDLELIKETLYAYPVSDEETIHCIKAVYTAQNILLEPHGAVGWVANEKFKKQLPLDKKKMVVLETAHPAKFPEVIEKELHFSPEMPHQLIQILNKEENKITIHNEYDRFKELLLSL